MMDANMHLNNGLLSLLRLNWRSYPWAKDLYLEIERSYGTLCARMRIEELREHKEDMTRQAL